MATVSTKEIKNRIRSMGSTRQITKAMEMVAASKLRHAQARVQNSRPYFEILHDTIASIVRSDDGFSSPYLEKRTVKRKLFIVIAGDRGLAGGYNSNILKLAHAAAEGTDTVVLPIGKKAVDYFRFRNVPMLTESYADASQMSMGDCFTVAKQLAKAYKARELDEIAVFYTEFASMLSQTPKALSLLPLTADGEKKTGGGEMLYEPDSTQVFEAIVPEYLGGILYGALCESRASEQAARRTAMDSATRNADEMIADLSLKFNQARQAAITQEITEIVAGS